MRPSWFPVILAVVTCIATGASLQPESPSNLSGKVSAAGKAGLDLERLGVQMQPEDGNGPDAIADITRDGAFSLTGLRNTTYRLKVTGLPDGWYMHSALAGGQNILVNGLKLSEDNAGQHLEITVSPGAAMVQGLVLDPVYRDVVSRAVVELFPDPANTHRADLFHAVAADENGRFVIKNIVPGKYRVIAFMGKLSGEPTYDDSLIAATVGIRVTLAEKQAKSLELGLFEAHR